MSDSVYPDEPIIGQDSTKARFAKAVRIAFDDSYQFRNVYTQKWNYNFRLLNGAPREVMGKSWRTNRFVNVVRVASLLLKSRFWQGLPVAEAEGRTLQANVNADSLNNILLYDQERGRLEKELGNVIEDGINYACGIMYEGWRTETRDNVPRSDTFWDKMIAAIKKNIPGFKETQILYDGPEFRWVDPWTFYWDKNGTDIDDCAFNMEVTYETMYQLRKDPAIDQDVLKEVRAITRDISSMKAKEADDRLRALGLPPADAKRIYGKIKEGLHEKILYWGAYDINDDGIEEEVKGIVIDGYFVGFLDENPFNHGKKPYAKWDFNEIPGFFVGYSLLDQVAQSQEEINDGTNQLGDVRKLTAKPIIKIKLGADIQPEDISFAPGALVPVENMEDIDFYQPDTAAILALLEYLKAERENFQLLSGMNDVSLGQQDVGIGDNTATGAAIAQEQTELRYKSPAIGLDLFIQRIGEMLIWNEQQFRNSKEIVPVRKDGVVQYKTIRPKDISGLFSYRIISSSLTNQTPTIRINNLLKVLQVIQQNPLYDSSKVIDELIEELGVDPKSLKQAGPSNMDSVQKLAALPPDQQQAAIAKLSPEDQQLMQKALQAVTQGNASQTNPAQPGQAIPTAPVQGGGNPVSAIQPAGPPPMGVPR